MEKEVPVRPTRQTMVILTQTMVILTQTMVILTQTMVILTQTMVILTQTMVILTQTMVILTQTHTGQTPDGQGGPENATVPQEQQGGPGGPENQTGQTPAGTNGQTGTEQTNPANPTGPPTTFPSQQGGPETATGPQTTQNNLAPTSPTTGGQPTKTVSSEQFQSTLKSALTSEGIQSAQLANAATAAEKATTAGELPASAGQRQQHRRLLAPVQLKTPAA